MRILIIRHGDPDYENDCLTEKGKIEAGLLAQRLSKEKIDYIYSSPLGRAKETCLFTARALGRESEVEIKDWLKEFGYPVVFPSGEESDIPWDMLPAEWTGLDRMYDAFSWKEQAYYQDSAVAKEYDHVIASLDELLQKHGYKREGRTYRVEKSNKDTIAIFCHFGLESVLLSRLLNISPVQLWHHFVALTSSVTTLYTEERREGTAIFRCCGFGDVSHLYAGGEPPSFSARFCETFDSDERHD